MLTYPEFVASVQAAIPRFNVHWLNAEQDQAVSAPQNPPTFIVAGPGAGKTTVLVLRVLKLILVDQIPPTGIIATTFTRKAAGELRSAHPLLGLRDSQPNNSGCFGRKQRRS